MNEIYLSRKDIKSLSKFKIDKEIYNTEGNFYVYNDELLKLYRHINSIYLNNKKKTLENLIAYSTDYPNDSLVYPNNLVYVDDEFKGFTMPYIEQNKNLEKILRSKKVPLSQKLEYLKQVYRIIEFVMNHEGLILNDIHEGNFILDKTDDTIKAIDLDSAYFECCAIYPSKYLINRFLIPFCKKYRRDSFVNMRIIPDKNTMILCYVYMVVNTLSNSDSEMWSKSEYKKYLKFLNQNDCSKELIDSLASIYNKRNENYFAEEFLDGIDPSIDYSMPQKLKRESILFYRSY